MEHAVVSLTENYSFYHQRLSFLPVGNGHGNAMVAMVMAAMATLAMATVAMVTVAMAMVAMAMVAMVTVAIAAPLLLLSILVHGGGGEIFSLYRGIYIYMLIGHFDDPSI